MQYKVSAIITIIFFLVFSLFPNIALASPWSVGVLAVSPQDKDEDGKKDIIFAGDYKVMPVTEGEPVPYTGILFSVEAAAKLSTDKEVEEQRCQLKVEKEVNTEKAKSELELANEKAAKEALAMKYVETVNLKNEQINFLAVTINKMEKKQNRVNLTGLWVFLGVLGGVTLTIAGAAAIDKVEK